MWGSERAGESNGLGTPHRKLANGAKNLGLKVISRSRLRLATITPSIFIRLGKYCIAIILLGRTAVNREECQQESRETLWTSNRPTARHRGDSTIFFVSGRCAP